MAPVEGESGMNDIVERLRSAADVVFSEDLELHITQETCTRAADEIERLQSVVFTLRKAAEAVCHFDWSDNDADAVAAIDTLRELLPGTKE